MAKKKTIDTTSLKLKVLDTQNATHMLTLQVAIMDGDKKLEVRNFGYSPETPQDQIEAELKQYLETYKSEAASAEANAARDKAQEAAAATLEALKDKEIE